MKVNDLVTWRNPMNEAEEKDIMRIVQFCDYTPERVVVRHINENKLSIENIKNLKTIYE